MAATISDLAHGSVQTAGTTLVTGGTVTGTVANRDWFVVIATKNSTSVDITSVSDTAGNIYTERVHAELTNTDQFYIFTAPVTADISSGTITVNYASSTSAARNIQVYRVRPGAGETVSLVSSGSTAGESSTSHTIGPVSVPS